jgi:hypothetical protein
MFGQKPPCGTGFVDILIDETKLPEGGEEDLSVFEADLVAANLRIDEEDAVNRDEIEMAW